MLEESRAAGKLTPVGEIAATFALYHAEFADRAARAGDGAAVTRHGVELAKALDRLAIGKPAGGDAGDGSGGGTVLELFGTGPEMGDAADA